MRLSAATIGLGFALVGCGALEHNEYVQELAEGTCSKIKSCALGQFESEYRDYDDCVDEVADNIDEFDDNLPRACDFDGEEARRCVSRVRSMGCEEYAEGATSMACDLVWTCND